jgi:Tol biopolymer transport system component
MRFARIALSVTVLVCSLAVQSASADHSQIDLVSVGPAGGNGSFPAGVRSISPDGHAIAFETAESLVPQDTDSEYDVYVRSGDSLTLASVGPIGGNGPYGAFGQLSQDGTAVVFSTSERLTANDQDTTSDDYRFKDGVTTLLTPQSSSGFSIYESSTADGSRLIFFTTDALVPEDTDGTFDLYESSAAGPRLVSTGPNGSSGYAYCFALRFGYSCDTAQFSEDGSRILFRTGERLLPEDTDDALDWYARSGDNLELLTPGALSAGDDQFSSDGTRLFFTTADGLDPSDTDGATDVYELANGVTKLLTPNTGPSYPPTTGDVRLLKVINDGEAILVSTDARAVPEDTDLFSDIYLFRNGEPTLISNGPLANTDRPITDVQFDGATDDASHVVFTTAERLVSDDTDEQPDLYEHFDGTTRLVTTGAKEGCPFDPPYDQCPGGEFEAISNDGLRIFFESGQQLAPEDTDRMSDLYERFAGETTLISKGEYAENTWSFCPCYQFSDDGRRVAFNSPAQIAAQDTDSQIDVYVATANEPPSCAGVTASQRLLSPANHKFRPVTLSGATDPDGDAVSIRVTGVTQDEPTGSAADAALTTSSNRVRLRAERDSQGDGRVYRIAFTATDSFGATCSGTAAVGVPRHGSSAVDSAPPAYDSLAP